MKKKKPIEPVYRAIGARLRYIRETLGHSQHDVAKKIGLTRVSIVNVEAGRQRILLHDIEKIAEAFSMTPRQFMKGIWF